MKKILSLSFFTLLVLIPNISQALRFQQMTDLNLDGHGYEMLGTCKPLSNTTNSHSCDSSKEEYIGINNNNDCYFVDNRDDGECKDGLFVHILGKSTSKNQSKTNGIWLSHDGNDDYWVFKGILPDCHTKT
ncbi:MAG: hypothetical protein IJR92_02920, partial [Alphaproteobacteria bacterium]|nr:hypothetical protein [Alphaproteobacteria bacterium]